MDDINPKTDTSSLPKTVEGSRLPIEVNGLEINGI